MASNWPTVYANALESMFFVMLTPSADVDDLTELDDIAEAVETVADGEERARLVRTTKVSTGFAVGTGDGNIAVLTTAHSLEHLFRASRPIMASRINRLYTTQVLCRHYESAFLQAGRLDPQILDAEREYAFARVSWLDCSKDLMLLSVPMNAVTRFGGGGLPCPGPHPALRACVGALDPPTTECLMVSWQEYKSGMMSIGRIGAMRTVFEINNPNLFEYNINLLEVQVSSRPGYSGSPLLNRNGELIGVLHALHIDDPSHSYFIALEHVRTFLNRFTMDVPPPPPPPVAALAPPPEV